MVRLAPHALKISVSIFRRKLTNNIYLCLLQAFVLRYLNDLLSKLNKEGKPSGIRRFLKVKKISEDISAYRQRVHAAKEDFLVGGSLSSLSFTLEWAADPYDDHDTTSTLRCP